MPNRAERRLCAKAGHPYAKIMEDGSTVCLNCKAYLPPPPPDKKNGKRV